MGASMNSSAAKNRGTPRRRMTVEKRREQIMDAARDIANAEGFHAVTLDRVAEACGITRTLIYQQFGNLSGLLVAMVDREYTRAARDFAEAAKRPPRKGQSRLTKPRVYTIDRLVAQAERLIEVMFPH